MTTPTGPAPVFPDPALSRTLDAMVHAVEGMNITHAFDRHRLINQVPVLDSDDLFAVLNWAMTVNIVMNAAVAGPHPQYANRDAFVASVLVPMNPSFPKGQVFFQLIRATPTFAGYEAALNRVFFPPGAVQELRESLASQPWAVDDPLAMKTVLEALNGLLPEPARLSDSDLKHAFVKGIRADRPKRKMVKHLFKLPDGTSASVYDPRVSLDMVADYCRDLYDDYVVALPTPASTFAALASSPPAPALTEGYATYFPALFGRPTPPRIPPASRLAPVPAPAPPPFPFTLDDIVKAVRNDNRARSPSRPPAPPALRPARLPASNLLARFTHKEPAEVDTLLADILDAHDVALTTDGQPPMTEHEVSTFATMASRAATPANRPRTCYRCHRPGHFSVNCPYASDIDAAVAAAVAAAEKAGTKYVFSDFPQKIHLNPPAQITSLRPADAPPPPVLSLSDYFEFSSSNISFCDVPAHDAFFFSSLTDEQRLSRQKSLNPIKNLRFSDNVSELFPWGLCRVVPLNDLSPPSSTFSLDAPDPSEALAFDDSLVCTSRAWINGTVFPDVLNDSGSNAGLVTTDFLAGLARPPVLQRLDRPGFSNGISGRVSFLGYVYLHVSYDTDGLGAKWCKFYVVPACPRPIIFGTPQLRSLRVELSFWTSTLHWHTEVDGRLHRLSIPMEVSSRSFIPSPVLDSNSARVEINLTERCTILPGHVFQNVPVRLSRPLLHPSQDFVLQGIPSLVSRSLGAPNAVFRGDDLNATCRSDDPTVLKIPLIYGGSLPLVLKAGTTVAFCLDMPHNPVPTLNVPDSLSESPPDLCAMAALANELQPSDNLSFYNMLATLPSEYSPPPRPSRSTPKLLMKSRLTCPPKPR